MDNTHIGLRRKTVCRTSPKGPAVILDVQAFVSRVRYSARIIWDGAATGCVAELMPVDMIPAGEKPENYSFNSIHYVFFAKRKERLSPPP